MSEVDEQKQGKALFVNINKSKTNVKKCYIIAECQCYLPSVWLNEFLKLVFLRALDGA